MVIATEDVVKNPRLCEANVLDAANSADGEPSIWIRCVLAKSDVMTAETPWVVSGLPEEGSPSLVFCYDTAEGTKQFLLSANEKDGGIQMTEITMQGEGSSDK